DHDLCIRGTAKGIMVVARPDLKVVHNHFPTDFPTFFRREVWHGSGDFQSFDRFLNSRVALAAVFFLALHVVALVAGLVSVIGGVMGGALIVVFIFLAST